jgi:hypothetical protein
MAGSKKLRLLQVGVVHAFGMKKLGIVGNYLMENKKQEE